MNKFQAGTDLRPSPDADAAEAWLSVVRAYVLCEKLLAIQLAPLALSIAQHDILANIARDPGIGQSVLAGRLLVARSNVSMLLTEMAKQELVERRTNTADGRANHLYLTDKGRGLLQRSSTVQGAVVGTMAKQTTADELTTITGAMRRIADALSAELAAL